MKRQQRVETPHQKKNQITVNSNNNKKGIQNNTRKEKGLSICNKEKYFISFKCSDRANELLALSKLDLS